MCVCVRARGQGFLVEVYNERISLLNFPEMKQV